MVLELTFASRNFREQELSRAETFASRNFREQKLLQIEEIHKSLCTRKYVIRES